MAETIRILHLIESLGPGGAERLLYTNLSRLDRRRFDGIVCHLYNAGLHWAKPIQKVGYPVISLGMSDLHEIRRGFFGLLQVLCDHQIDLVHTHLYGANLYGRLAGSLKGIRVLSSLHNPDFGPEALMDNADLSRPKAYGAWLLDRFSCRLRGLRFLAVSEFMKRFAVHSMGIPPERIEVIYNPVDLSQFKSLPKESVAYLRKEIGLAREDPILLCIGRLSHQKGQWYLIQALPAICRRFPEVKLLLVGAGLPKVEERLRDLARSQGVEGNVRFLGVRNDIVELLALCDIFVFPSLYEGLGIALVEAMAMERPCIASRTGPIPEVVENGGSGVLVEPKDPQQIAGAVVGLLDDSSLRAKMGWRGRRIVEERFNVDRTIHQLEALYERLGGDGRP
ncbi:MAG: glycosyltransferase [Deltaproteobacteria bacterium]|nr:glycosyltransferase [Deltaproteobacteria bacterium]